MFNMLRHVQNFNMLRHVNECQEFGRCSTHINVALWSCPIHSPYRLSFQVASPTPWHHHSVQHAPSHTSMLQILAGRMQTKPPDQYQNQQDGRCRGRLDARRRSRLDDEDAEAASTPAAEAASTPAAEAPKQDGRRRGRLDARRGDCLDAVRRRRGRLDDEDDGADDDGGVWVLLHFQLRAKR